ncbi:hypothetical protein [Halovivax limisalsi]|uniref:hypothetical protein n=1 Tax=Halovivax limisalsi TaxID=1453760 RepID=UPI001FFD31E3|nr:hypothetical protein [Halovivax limisalsi]
MRLQQLLSNPKRTGLIYVAIGSVSLLKAIALRDDRRRFRRELTDAALFLGVGIALRRFAAMKAEKRAELESVIPDRLRGTGGSTGGGGLRERASGRLRGDRRDTKSSTSTAIRDRARSVLAD